MTTEQLQACLGMGGLPRVRQVSIRVLGAVPTRLAPGEVHQG